MLTFDDFQLASVKRDKETKSCLGKWSASDWGNALAGEVGEACNFIKKLRRGDFNDEPGAMDKFKKELGKEPADVLSYVFLTASHFDINVEDITRSKFNEVS